MFLSKKLGEVSKDFVIFSRKQVSDMAACLDCTDEQLITQHNGIVCSNMEITEGSVQSLSAVQEDGNIQSVVVIGLDQEKFARFLNEGETTFQEYLQSHPLYSEINWDEPLARNEEIFDQIVEEFHNKNQEAL